MTNNHEKILIEEYLSGDEEALEILIRSYLKPIYNFIYRYVGNAGDAGDITQEVFVKIWRHLKKFNQSKNFKTWIFAIAKNTAIDFLKKSRSAFGGKKAMPFSEFINEDGENTLTETLVDPAPLPDELFGRADVGKMLNAAIKQLAPKYRMVLFLRYNDHFTFREIAESSGESLNTVKSRHRRALIMLRKTLCQTAEH